MQYNHLIHTWIHPQPPTLGPASHQSMLITLLGHNNYYYYVDQELHGTHNYAQVDTRIPMVIFSWFVVRD